MGSDLPDAIGRLRAEMWHPGPVLIPISDTGDERLEDYTRLTDVALRRKLETDNGLYMAESTKVIVRAITAGHRPRSVLADERWLDELAPALRRAGGDPEGGDIPVYVCDEAALQTITGFHLHRGAIAAMNRPSLKTAEELLASLPGGARRVVVLEGLVDHTNVGAVFRSAAGLGVDAVLVTPACADPLYRRSVRVSMGNGGAHEAWLHDRRSRPGARSDDACGVRPARRVPRRGLEDRADHGGRRGRAGCRDDRAGRLLGGDPHGRRRRLLERRGGQRRRLLGTAHALGDRRAEAVGARGRREHGRRPCRVCPVVPPCIPGESWPMPESSPLERHLASIFAHTIRERRMELGLSQEQVALRADIDRNHYQLMESARSDRRSNRAVNPRFFTLLKLANALEMPVEELLHPISRSYRFQVERGEML